MKTKTIEDYYCTTRFRSDIIHITEKEDSKKLCNNKFERWFYPLSIIYKYTNEEPITLYSNMCKTCIKRLPNNVREEVIYNYVLAKLKS